MQADHTAIEASAMRKIGGRILPFLGLLYFAAFIDRSNISFAAPTMNHELGFSAYVYGLGAGIFFIGYFLFEVPSNLILHRIGARRWIARIMMTWALVAAAMALINGPLAYYATRFLLGAAEAGFFPGVVYYLTYWAPAQRRARMIGLFMTAIAISTAIGGPLSSLVLKMDGVGHIAGWRWLFLMEAVPSLILGAATLFLAARPAAGRPLADGGREGLARRKPRGGGGARPEDPRQEPGRPARSDDPHPVARLFRCRDRPLWGNPVDPADPDRRRRTLGPGRLRHRHSLRHRGGRHGMVGPPFRPVERTALAYRRGRLRGRSRPGRQRLAGPCAVALGGPP